MRLSTDPLVLGPRDLDDDHIPLIDVRGKYRGAIT